MILAQHADIDDEQRERKEKIIKLVYPEEGGEASSAGIEQALSLLDRRDRLEQTVLVALKANRKDYQSAFAAISKNTRYIYIHAYQSFLWNRAVSQRLKTCGREVLVGDLVVEKGAELEEEQLNSESDEAPVDEKAEVATEEVKIKEKKEN